MVICSSENRQCQRGPERSDRYFLSRWAADHCYVESGRRKYVQIQADGLASGTMVLIIGQELSLRELEKRQDSNSEVNERFKTENEAEYSLLSPLVVKVTASSPEQSRSSLSRTETHNQNSNMHLI